MTCSRVSLHFPQCASTSPPSCGFLLIPRMGLGFMVVVLLVRSQGVEGSGGFLSGQASWSVQRSGRRIYRQLRGPTSKTTHILLQDAKSY